MRDFCNHNSIKNSNQRLVTRLSVFYMVCFQTLLKEGEMSEDES